MSLCFIFLSSAISIYAMQCIFLIFTTIRRSVSHRPYYGFILFIYSCAHIREMCFRVALFYTIWCNCALCSHLISCQPIRRRILTCITTRRCTCTMQTHAIIFIFIWYMYFSFIFPTSIYLYIYLTVKFRSKMISN